MFRVADRYSLELEAARFRVRPALAGVSYLSSVPQLLESQSASQASLFLEPVTQPIHFRYRVWLD